MKRLRNARRTRNTPNAATTNNAMSESAGPVRGVATPLCGVARAWLVHPMVAMAIAEITAPR